jgi:ribonuclease P protein component
MKKAYRVTDNKDFQRIIHHSRFYSNGSFAVYFCPRSLMHCRVGISVSKKRGNAVVRNRIKRQVRMMVDAAVKFDGWYDLVIIIRSQYPANDYATNNKALNDILKKVYNTN